MGQRRTGTDFASAAARGPDQGSWPQDNWRGKRPGAKNDEKAEDDKEEPAVPEINDGTFDETMGAAKAIGRKSSASASARAKTRLC